MFKRRSMLVFAAIACGLLVAMLVFLLSPSGTNERAAAADGGNAEGSIANPASAEPLADETVDSGLPPRESNASSELATERNETKPAETVERKIEWSGKVVDARRRPAAGCAVSLFLAQREPLRTRTEADGSFRLLIPQPSDLRMLPGSIHATDHKGNAAIMRVALFSPLAMSSAANYLWQLELDTMVLEPAGRVRVSVSSETGPATGAEVSLESGIGRVPTATGVTDSGGIARFEGIPAGDLTVFASDTNHRRTAATTVVVAATEVPVTIALEPARSIPVFVTDHETGLPIPGAKISVEEGLLWPTDDLNTFASISRTLRPAPIAVAPTDAQGRTRIEGLETTGKFRVAAAAEGYDEMVGAKDERTHSMPIELATQEIRVSLAPTKFRTVRWPIVAGECAVPADGTPIVLRNERLIEDEFSQRNRRLAAVIEGGQLVMEHVPMQSISRLAETPAGELSRIRCDSKQEVGREISFRRPRTVEVVVQDPRGAPIKAARVELRDQGNGSVSRRQITDEDGRTSFSGLYDGIVDVHAGLTSKRSPSYLDHTVGSVNLGLGDGRVVAVLADPLDFVLRFTIDGQPQLPAKFRIRTMAGAIDSMQENSELGELRLQLQPFAQRDSVTFYLSAVGFVSREVKTELLPDQTPIVVDVPLQRAGSVLATVRPPADGRLGLLVEEWKADLVAPEPIPFSRQSLREANAAGGKFLFQPLEPGRYRIRDEVSEIVSSLIEVGLGTVEVSLDLSQVLVEGQVVVPEGEDVTLARVVRDEASMHLAFTFDAHGLKSPGIAVGGDGRFTLRVATDSTLSLRAWHPWLVPASEGGVVETRGTAKDVVLRLCRSGTASFRCAWPTTDSKKQVEELLLYFLDASNHDSIVQRTVIPVRDGLARFAGHPVGRFTLWVEPLTAPSPLAPFVFNGMTLTGDDQDLGEVQFGNGASIRAVMRIPEGEDPPRIMVTATHEDTPKYWRSMDYNGEQEAVLTGLGSGSFKVLIRKVMDFTTYFESTVELDGRSELVIPVDLH